MLKIKKRKKIYIYSTLFVQPREISRVRISAFQGGGLAGVSILTAVQTICTTLALKSVKSVCVRTKHQPYSSKR